MGTVNWPPSLLGILSEKIPTILIYLKLHTHLLCIHNSNHYSVDTRQSIFSHDSYYMPVGFSQSNEIEGYRDIFH